MYFFIILSWIFMCCIYINVKVDYKEIKELLLVISSVRTLHRHIMSFKDQKGPGWVLFENCGMFG